MREFHEVNLRTYVRGPDGMPGVWFFSLDAASAPAALAARLATGLPYFRARIRRDRRAGPERYTLRRLAPHGGVPAHLDALWQPARRLGVAPAGSLDHFLTERYALYSHIPPGPLVRIRVSHSPWVLHEARVYEVKETIRRAALIPDDGSEPFVRASPGVSVTFHLPELVTLTPPRSTGAARRRRRRAAPKRARPAVSSS